MTIQTKPAETSAVSVLSNTAMIVASYVANNQIDPGEITTLIRSVHSGLTATDEPVVEIQEPAVSIKSSIKPDFITCLEDGKKLKMLKRHLSTRYGLTPDAYRQKWGLPSDYPMVAPNYAKKRADLARQIGLGKISRKKSAKA